MALDVGDRTIGVALSDETETLASPLLTIARTNQRVDAAKVATLARDHGARLIVAGWPLNLRGEAGPQADKVHRFVEKLKGRTRVPVELSDERLTTAQVERAMIEADVSRDRRREVKDELAATLILQSWLDARREQAPA